MQVRSFAWRGRASACLTALVASVTLAACGSSSSSSSSASSSSSGASSNTSASSTASSSASGGSAKAQAVVAKYTAPVPFSVLPLSKKPGVKTIAEVNCTLPLCSNGSVGDAAKVLGWHYVNVSFDLTKGPPAYAAAFARALQAKPNYIAAVGVFPPATIAPLLAQAKAAGVSVMYIAGLHNNPVIKECSNCAAYFLKVGAVEEDIVAAKFGLSANTVIVGDPALVGTGEINAGTFAEAARLGATKPATLNISSQAAPATNAASVLAYLQRNPNVKAVLNSFPDELVALPGALARAGLTSKVAYINTGPQVADLGYIKAGTLAATIAIETHAAWWRAVDAAARLAVGDPVTVEGGDWWQIITKDNIGAVLKAGGGHPEPPNYQQVYARAWKVR